MSDSRMSDQMKQLDEQLNEVMRRFDQLEYNTNWDVVEPAKSRLHRQFRDVFRDKAAVLGSMQRVDPSFRPADIVREIAECERRAAEQSDQIVIKIG